MRSPSMPGHAFPGDESTTIEEVEKARSRFISTCAKTCSNWRTPWSRASLRTTTRAAHTARMCGAWCASTAVSAASAASPGSSPTSSAPWVHPWYGGHRRQRLWQARAPPRAGEELPINIRIPCAPPWRRVSHDAGLRCAAMPWARVVLAKASTTTHASLVEKGRWHVQVRERDGTNLLPRLERGNERAASENGGAWTVVNGAGR